MGHKSHGSQENYLTTLSSCLDIQIRNVIKNNKKFRHCTKKKREIIQHAIATQ